MAKNIKFHFDPDQDHQVLAIEQTVRLFEGHPHYAVNDLSDGETIGNLAPGLQLERSWLEDNLRSSVMDYNHHARQRRLTPIKNPPRIVYEEGFPLEVGPEMRYAFSNDYPAFTVEMETGTGKTYTYLRTIYELRENYGFRKFVIVVPSRAIYEGTAKSFEATREHFKSLYGNETTNLIRYDSQQISKLRGFADTPSTNILVMTMAAFVRKSNKLYKATEKLQGERLPFEYIADTRPILILDESQNYTTKKSKRALLTLNPLFALNYSATPVEKPNLIYRLTPADAFQRNLVKRIEVLGVEETERANDNQLNFSFAEPVTGWGGGPAVETELNTVVKGQVVRKSMRLRKGDDLYEKTNNPAFEGIVIDEIDRGRGVILFTNGDEMTLTDTGGGTVSQRDRFRVQIQETIRAHMRKQKSLIASGKTIKVLSLFFIDRVANYVPSDGIIKTLFDQEYRKIAADYGHFRGTEPERARRGYFAQSKKGLVVDTAIEDKDKKAADRQAEREAYRLIMKGKTELLSFDEPVAFIFAHSALKEGWDNPNVFQICTLNETKSERKKRQEIGRGLRLPVDQSGQRDFDANSNVLTVIANESYDTFAAQLQHEYREAGDAAPPAPSNARRKAAKRNNAIFHSAEFRSFWNKLMQGTDYTIHVDTEEVVRQCIDILNDQTLPEPKLSITRGEFVITTYRITFADISLTGLASIEIERENTKRPEVDKFQLWVKTNDPLDTKDENLKGLRVVEVRESGKDSVVVFANRGSLRLGETMEFSTQQGQRVTQRDVALSERTYVIPDFIRRAAEATNLTRRTLIRILGGINEAQRGKIERNPEGFSSLFVSTVKNVLATHVADNVEYTLNGQRKDERELAIFFPEQQKYPQKEIMPGSGASLYDQVQYDSAIEERFVRWKLNEDPRIVCFFKFPPKFRINTPRIILNYNPDWGIIRRDDGGMKLQLVRETKGNADVSKLQFPDEARKIACAKKHFALLGIDYRVITGEEEKWWA
jgi:type III restriction enzyme